jgi:outer membrane protein TolC
LLAPIFYGGRLKAQQRQAEAVRSQLLNQYGQTVLTAFQEVENALVQEQRQKEQLEIIRRQVSLAERTYQQLRIEYLNGTSEYLDVLTALNQEQQLKRDLITAKLDLLSFRVNLYRALAGGLESKEEIENPEKI